MERISLNSQCDNNFHESDESTHDKIMEKMNPQSEQSVEENHETSKKKPIVTENVLEGVNVINIKSQDEGVISPETGVIELLDDSSEETEGMIKKIR